ncbi:MULTISPECIES: helix-turn-helix domain-containing GNAT family N-acetyltransferase [unclassified Roseitalea]|uniref:bifunctional helix-turn-helix transcriptional regulator/GNAT family N-acetyltransferase n=1 Tax=unclassified Roseitalea TaxID=2639107 RepID=UPI0027402B00|nr:MULTISPECIES: helix-turn-helix domain-containing GNAT family N-acetyltransferase [unclassified Roseitalea]
MTDDAATIAHIRDASRRLVRELGFMQATLAGTDLSPSAVHAIIEVGLGRNVSARDLVAALRLEKSTVSRLVGALVADGYLAEARDGTDTRLKRLTLTDRGRQAYAAINAFAGGQVRGAVDRLDGLGAPDLARALDAYARALGDQAQRQPVTDIVEGYVPGLIGRAVAMHADYYSRAAGFGAPFEATVAGAMAGFVPRLGRDGNAIWSARRGGAIVGTIAIDGEDLAPNVAHLRWFIVADGLRGAGIGRALMQAAMEFVDSHGFAETRLWTFSGLDAARALYERAGFRLVGEKPGRQWGEQVREQQFVRPHPGRAADEQDRSFHP